MTPSHFSASGIGTYLACPRKWAWTYILGLRSPGTASTERGKAVHSILEAHLLTGEPIDQDTEEGRIAAEGAPLLRDLLPPAFRVEQEFHLHGRHHWLGYKDVEYPGGVIDHKTTSDFKWAKTPGQLLYDPQAVLYAHDNAKRFLVPSIALSWVYYRTRKPYQAKTVTLNMSAEHAARGFEALEKVADEAEGIRSAAPEDDEGKRRHILQVRPNTHHCDDYGGCPHKGLCNISPFRAKETHVEQESLFDRMTRLNAKDDAQVSNPPASVPSFVPVNPPEGAAPPPPPPPPEAPKAARKAKAPKAEEAPPAPAPSLPLPMPTAAAPIIMRLYVGCFPTKGEAPVVHFDQIVMQAKALLHKEMGLADYRFKGYGEGQGLMVQAVMATLDGMGQVGALYADPRTPEVGLCLSLLRNRAIEVTEGLS